MSVSHDQNFKNLILDYPREALAFFAPEEAAALHGDASVRITPIRQEQLKDRLGDRFFELDVPLLVEWPDGRREAVLFLVEEQTEARRFSIHRLASYCLAVSEACETTRVVPVVIFLRSARHVPRRLVLGSERHQYLEFRYLACELPELPALDYMKSDNVVARVNLPNMRWQPHQKVDVYGHAVQGLLKLELDKERRLKYFDFIDMYMQLDEHEQQVYAERYPQENQTMQTWSERQLNKGIQQGLVQGLEQGIQQGMQRGIQQGMQRGIQEGMQQGIARGMQQGQQEVLARQLQRRFGPLSSTVEARLASASSEELAQWAERILDARSVDEVFGAQ